MSDQSILQTAKTLNPSRWRGLHAAVITELEEARKKAGIVPGLTKRMETLNTVLAWIERNEEVLDKRFQNHSREFSGPGIGEWDDLSEW